MSSWVVCDRGHRGGRCRDAAIEFSKRGSLEVCRRTDCDAPRRYLVSHSYANVDQAHEYELEKVARLYSDNDADGEGYDPMIFLLRHRQTGERMVWPFYWGKDRSGRWRVGQFPPLLSIGDIKKLIQSLELLVQDS